MPSRSFSARVSKDKASISGRRGMILPFQPLSLTFDEIRYAVDMPQVLYILLRCSISQFNYLFYFHVIGHFVVFKIYSVYIN